jgi:hypothetical protein
MCGHTFLEYADGLQLLFSLGQSFLQLVRRIFRYLAKIGLIPLESIRLPTLGYILIKAGDALKLLDDLILFKFQTDVI